MIFGNKPIDAQAELARIEGERDPGQLQRQRRHVPGQRAFLVLATLLGLGVSASVLYLSFSRGEHAPANSQGAIRNTLPELRLTPLEPPKAPPAPPEPAQPAPVPVAVALPPVQITTPPGPSPEERAIRARRLSSGLQGSATQTSTGTEGYLSALQAMPGESPSSPEFAQSLRPLRLQTSRATRLQHRSYLLTQGSTIDCVLLTRLVSTQAGMVTCQVPSDVFSADGSQVLLDRGTRLTGYQQSGLSQGQARIFVVWSRAETPTGVVINLDSPGTGPLGEAGFGGYVDTHFWERFQGAVFVSMLGDLGQWISGRASRDGGMQFNNTTSGAQDAVSTVLERTADIPPTLYKNQGELAAVMVARDLDFSGVYGAHQGWVPP